MNKINIAIDGPASSGKSTVAKILAKDFKYIYIDSGAMYRSITYLAIKNNINLDSEDDVVNLISKFSIIFEQKEKKQLVLLNGEDITEIIRQPNITRNVSKISSLSKIRSELIKQQQAMAKNRGVVMDGRDIGTVVLPYAEVKIFLIARIFERVERRYKENLLKGIKIDYETLKSEIEERDYLDTSRKISPLVQADDSILVDTTNLSVKEVVIKIKNIINNKLRCQREQF